MLIFLTVLVTIYFVCWVLFFIDYHWNYSIYNLFDMEDMSFFSRAWFWINMTIGWVSVIVCTAFFISKSIL